VQHDAFDDLPVEALEGLADALESRRLAAPYRLRAVERAVPPPDAPRVLAALEACRAEGHPERSIAWALRILARERAARRHARDDLELVWTGPDLPLSSDRDTLLVVRELFESATNSVMVAGYKFYQVPAVFGPLAERMRGAPGLSVRMFVHVDPVREGDEAEAVKRFAIDFRQRWPSGAPLPAVFYYPPTTQADARGRPSASLHAKCVVVDGEHILVTSANFSEAAQLRNIEVGIRLRDRTRAGLLRKHFEDLVSADVLRPIPLPI
jgi:phosphatidylserine/phosphatidylglycerophosphate/cardiolipin synthase-like enzyme